VLPIGRPLANYRAYVLDSRLVPVGIGITGELYLGGAGLARGYVNAPELTAECFIADPFSPGRLYRTGDRARWRADGTLEFLGRVDEQVKIRGFRVEPGEVAAQLRRQPGIREAAVIAQTTSDGARLIAYYTADETAEIELLRKGLAAGLPDYMVPAAFVKLDRLPLSPNGKLDRKALPDPEQSAFVARAFEPPDGEIEQKMAALWAELLKLDRVGRHDNFFELGGHSLLAVTLMERMHRQGLPGDVRALFTTPTIAGLAASLASSPLEVVPPNGIVPGSENITPEMLPLVKLTQAQIDKIVASLPGGATNLQDIYPLAPLQEGIFFQHLMTPQGDPYLSPVLMAFDGRDRLDSFLRALDTVVERHDVLRTGIVSKGVDQPVQYVLRHAAVPMEELTLDPSADAATELLARFDPRIYRMDLSKAPLFRVAIAYDRAHNRWLLLLLMHHLILDHTSQEILVAELRTLMENPQATLPAPLPYRNFIAQTVGVARAEHEAFFTRLLSTVDEPTAPFGLADIQSNGSAAAEGGLLLDAVLSRRIREQARSLGVTPASLFHLAWGAVLGQISGKSDVVFGTVLFGRMRSGAGADRVVGMFINTLPIRLELNGAGVAESALRTHRLLAELMVHEHAPLAIAQRSSAVPPPAPLFSSLFNYRYSAAGDGAAQWHGVEIVNASERTNYPLAMAVDDSGSTFALKALSHPLVDPERVCRYLQNSLTGLVDLLERAPQTQIENLPVLPRAERHMVLEEWNRTDAKFERGTLDALFAVQARKIPNAVAVIGPNGTALTYRELDEQSTRLARQLVAQGVRPERVVGVRMERSSETVVALLAILKAGGVYLPLDPAYPKERLDYIAADAGAILILDSIHGLAGDADLPQLNDPNRLAYIIYTSGTTGLPKGVAVPHTAPVNLAFARRACHDPLGVGDRVLAGISVGFDVSIGQLLLPLLSGATVVIAGDLKTMDVGEFWSFLAERRVSHINSVPSFFESILDAAPPAHTLSLKRLMLGGERLSGALVARIQQTLPGVEVVNMYGPTEACIDATYHTATEADLPTAVLPIGRPLPNYRAYVLDSRLEPVGIGVTGELYLGGAGLARGYVNAPELTAERFISDPFSSGRLYRTGDRARWRADGCLEFLGRVDEQVKIRGFRVEPGEIETQLRKQPGIREAAVIAQAAGSGTRLIAYYAGEDASDVEALRAGLAAVLPDYMLPSAFMKLDRLPLSANGKLDRKALPNPDQSAFTARAFEAPIGEAEEKMAALWADLLKLERVGRHDNFFELGGHSLLAMTLIERMQQHGLAGDVRALFGTPTIAALATASAAASLQEAAPDNLIQPGCETITPEMLPLVKLTQSEIDEIVSAVPGGAANVQDIYPLAPLQEGILFQHLLTEQGDPYLAPFLLGFNSRERLNSFLDALQRVVKRHDVLRTAMQWKGVPEPLQVVLRQVTVPLEEVAIDTSASAPDVASQLMKRFDSSVFRLDLSHAPLLRTFVAYDSARSRWLLLMLTHHLILDHTSMEIVVGELRALMENPQAPLPEPVPYRNFIAQSRSGATRDEQQAFFTRMLADVDEPTAPFGLLDTQANAETVEGRLQLDGTLGQRIREQARILGVTSASLFHLAWASVLSQICGKSDVVFGTVLLGRMRSGAGANRAVGMFINTLPIRLTMDKTGVAESVGRTQHLLAELMAHEHAPLALAQRCSSVLAPAPLFSSLFNYRYSAPQEGEGQWSGVEMVNSSERTNYPLAMAVDDTGSDFVLTALAHPSAQPQKVCQYLEQGLRELVNLLEHAPATPIESLHVLPRAERHRVVEEWNRTDAKFEEGTLDGLFSAQARRTPNALAVVGRDGEQLTYADLETQSTRFARQLVAQGVYPQRVVGVRMERSSETIVALLAILKAGGVYLPLDPAYPKERLDYIAADAGATVVLNSIHGLEGELDLPQLTDPHRLAYIIYTSGTTGQPKGVAVSHAAPVNLAFARRAAHDPIGPGDRILAGISVGFDVSIGQLLLPLLSGATVVIAGDLKAMSAGEFWAFLTRERVTHINSVPSFLDSILDAAPPTGTLALRRLMLGGEALSGALVSRIQHALPQVEVVNMYGPTEACIDATFHVATKADQAAAVLPIGRPLPNYRAYVLDRLLEPVGVGIPGELFLGGAGLAQGYVNKPELTAERFVADPFSTFPRGNRLYRTGDRARWREDGTLEFLGRVDEQVKIRGFRVEPAEIEAQLRNQPGIREAVVAYYEFGDTQISIRERGARLVAYYTGDNVPPVEDLRAGMAAVLPDYMIPSAFVKLDQLPLSPNGVAARACSRCRPHLRSAAPSHSGRDATDFPERARRSSHRHPRQFLFARWRFASRHAAHQRLQYAIQNQPPAANAVRSPDHRRFGDRRRVRFHAEPQRTFDRAAAGRNEAEAVLYPSGGRPRVLLFAAGARIGRGSTCVRTAGQRPGRGRIVGHVDRTSRGRLC
jgi:amino acid adenylation domain-containing protein